MNTKSALTRRLGLVNIIAMLLSATGIAPAPQTLASESNEARIEFERAILFDVAPAARARPDFAGLYFDNDRGGRVVVMVTGSTNAAEAALMDLAPRDGPGMEIVAASHTYADLQAAIDTLWKTWPARTQTEPIAIGLDTISNAIDVYVSWEALESAQEQVDAIQRELGIGIEVLGSEPVRETACSSRDNCVSPMKAGIRVRKGSTTGSICTMAFHVRIGTNEQFVTAGHCGATGSNNWYHQGYGYVGFEAGSLLYGGGIDMMRVEMPDAQASASIYGLCCPIGGWINAAVGLSVTVSAGASNRVVSNVIQDDYLTWTSPSCGCVVKGAKTSQTPGGSPGDSGSPTMWFGGPNKYYAVGTGSGTLGSSDLIARISDAVSLWGLSMVSG